MWFLVRCFGIALCIIIVPMKRAYTEDCKFTWANGTELVDPDFGVNLQSIMDTESPGTKLLLFQTTNVKEIKDVISNSISDELYMEPIFENNSLTLNLTDHFREYEINEISQTMIITVTFLCADGTTTRLEILQPIKDTNNHSPEFINVPYNYTLLMPFPKNIQLNQFQAISARDYDISNSNISFFLDAKDSNASGFSVVWLSKDKTNQKLFHMTLVTKTLINFVEDVEFTLYAQDAGSPTRSSETKIIIKVDRESSILRFAKPLYIADLTNLTAEEVNEMNVKFIEGDIKLSGGVDKAVTFVVRDDLSDYDEYFKLKIDDNSIVTLSLVDPPAKFFLESFIVLSLTATQPGAEETTILHLSLPGRAEVSCTSTTPPMTDSPDSAEKEECENTGYLVAVIILAVLLIIATLSIVIFTLKYLRIRKMLDNSDRIRNGRQQMGPTETEEVRHGSISPGHSFRKSVAFIDNVEDIKIARL